MTPHQHPPVFWTKEAERSLIEKVRPIPELWNNTNHNYSKKTLRRHLFGKIAEQLSQEFEEMDHLVADTVMVKWSILKKSFLRELAKTHSKSDTGISNISKWVHFKQLTFLMELITSGSDTASNFRPRVVTLGGESGFPANSYSLETATHLNLSTPHATENEVSNNDEDDDVDEDEAQFCVKIKDEPVDASSWVLEEFEGTNGMNRTITDPNSSTLYHKRRTENEPSNHLSAPAAKKRRRGSNATPAVDALSCMEAALQEISNKKTLAYSLYLSIDEAYKLIPVTAQLKLNNKINQMVLEEVITHNKLEM